LDYTKQKSPGQLAGASVLFTFILFKSFGSRAEQFFQTPRMVRQSRLDGWRALDRRMYPGEIVVGEEQGERCLVILPFLAVAVREPGEPTNHHSHGPICPLNVARANRLVDGIAYLWGSNYVNNPRWRITALVFLGRLTIDLDQRSVVDAISKDFWDSSKIGPETVRAQLESTIRGKPKLLSESLGIFRDSLAEMPSQEHFRMPFNRREAIGVSASFGIAATDFRLLLAEDKTPNFIGLNVPASHVQNGRLEKSLALLPGVYHCAQDRIAMNAGQTLRAPDRVALKNHPKSHNRPLPGKSPPIHGPGAFIGKRPLADIAPIPL
jgi:hypothetical protein